MRFILYCIFSHKGENKMINSPTMSLLPGWITLPLLTSFLSATYFGQGPLGQRKPLHTHCTPIRVLPHLFPFFYLNSSLSTRWLFWLGKNNSHSGMSAGKWSECGRQGQRAGQLFRQLLFYRIVGSDLPYIAWFLKRRQKLGFLCKFVPFLILEAISIFLNILYINTLWLKTHS